MLKTNIFFLIKTSLEKLTTDKLDDAIVYFLVAAIKQFAQILSTSIMCVSVYSTTKEHFVIIISFFL